MRHLLLLFVVISQFLYSAEKNALSKIDWNKAKWVAHANDSSENEWRYRVFKTAKMPNSTQVKSYPAPYFRSIFSLEASKKVKSAKLFIAGVGYHIVYFNEKLLTKDVLSPAPTSYDKQVLFVEHDITKLLKSKNILALHQGNGFFGQNIAFGTMLSYGKPMNKTIIEINYSDGSQEFIYSDASWKSSTGPIVFDNVYAGETYDSRLEMNDWTKLNFDDSNWEQAQIISTIIPKTIYNPSLLPPIRKVKSIQPRSVIKLGNKRFLVDFGQNMSGFVRIKVNEKSGTAVKIRYSEVLYKDSLALHTASDGAFATGVEQTDIFIANGSGWKSWEPVFTYHGFRYIEVSGISTLKTNQINAYFVHSDVKPIGTFSCSSEVLNQMYEVSKRTLLSNLHGIPEDCPAREKCGWLGDTHAFADFSMYNYDMHSFYSKYMQDIAYSLSDSTSAIQMVVPGKRTGGKASFDWGITLILLPYQMYLYYNDFEPFKHNYQRMKWFMQQMEKFENPDGLMTSGYGDWCPPLWDRIKSPEFMECLPIVSSTAYYYEVVRILEQMSLKLNDPMYSEKMRLKAQKIKDGFSKNFLIKHSQNGGEWFGSQTGTILALKFRLVDEKTRPAILETLVNDISKTRNYHHNCGIFGHKYIYSLLCDEGFADVAYKVITNPTFPSLAHTLASGLTTWPERQWEWKTDEDMSRSLNHAMHSGFALFFHENILGIKPVIEKPGFEAFCIQPSFPAALNFAKGSLKTKQGEIAVSWKRKNELIELEVKVPDGTNAQFIAPIGYYFYNKKARKADTDIRKKTISSGVNKIYMQSNSKTTPDI
jgi:alpha-L-rhamnosidase